MSQAAVYRLFNTDDEMIYVGSTVNLPARLRAHAKQKRWWPEVHRREISWHETPEEAQAVESEIIRATRPIHNRGVQVAQAVAHELREAIENGVYPPGAVLPSLRARAYCSVSGVNRDRPQGHHSAQV
ncbi:GIY-YIG nuclease family protein [Nonomuraea fuscirosea]|uniref:GIY-YIG nuclease family protein n=1 Tax=Nonomuraea fuscirosea TaxID=1291556 RepID=UPI0015E773B8|nr:GIY-YIG nuclease family protein [Nonomuraea fuscirosea]